MAGSNKLTETAAKQAKPKDKPYKLPDGGGMYLEVMTTGSKYWRLKYRYGDKEKRLALGVYPVVSISAAREKVRLAKAELADGNDPSEIKKNKKFPNKFLSIMASVRLLTNLSKSEKLKALHKSPLINSIGSCKKIKPFHWWPSCLRNYACSTIKCAASYRGRWSARNCR